MATPGSDGVPDTGPHFDSAGENHYPYQRFQTVTTAAPPLAGEERLYLYGEWNR